MIDPTRLRPAAPSRIVLAFAAIYLVWGSTYLAIRIAIESLPPLVMAGTRFMIAGTILYFWTRARGVPARNRAPRATRAAPRARSG